VVYCSVRWCTPYALELDLRDGLSCIWCLTWATEGTHDAYYFKLKSPQSPTQDKCQPYEQMRARSFAFGDRFWLGWMVDIRSWVHMFWSKTASKLCVARTNNAGHSATQKKETPFFDSSFVESQPSSGRCPSPASHPGLLITAGQASGCWATT
jgi:hypothetical protein